MIANLRKIKVLLGRLGACGAKAGSRREHAPKGGPYVLVYKGMNYTNGSRNPSIQKMEKRKQYRAMVLYCSCSGRA